MKKATKRLLSIIHLWNIFGNDKRNNWSLTFNLCFYLLGANGAGFNNFSRIKIEIEGFCQ